MENYCLQKTNVLNMGMDSIIKVAEKYNGDVIIEEEDRKFIITVTMNLKDF